MGTSQNHKTSRFFLSLTIIALSILAIRLVYLVVFSAPTKKYTNPEVSRKVVRGTIFDRNGRILAIETPRTNLYFHLKYIDDLEKAAEVVAPFLSMSASSVIHQAQKYDTYALVKENVDSRVIEPLRKAIEENGLRGAVTLEERRGRTYPATFHASQTLGFVDADEKGLEGIEYSQNAYLDRRPEVGGGAVTYGDDITLTLDIDIQYLLDVQVQDIADTYKPDFIAGIVLDAKSGDILALSSYPWYNPERVGQSREEERLNHAVNYLYEPGSVFKIFSLAAIMESAQADLSTPFLCDGSFTFDGGAIGCHERHGLVTPREMIAKSCNGAIASWALQTDSAAFRAFLVSLGFNDSYDIGLPSRSRANIRETKEWSARSKATISFGQELSCTALHMAVAATAIANDGIVKKPHLILRRSRGNALGERGEVLYERRAEEGERVMKAETARTILSYMESATEKGGTATRARVDGIGVAAKTGTAEIYDAEVKSYRGGNVLASTLAIADTEDPRYIIYIAAGSPRGDSLWGANVASPAVGNVIRGLVSQGKLVSSASGVLF